MLENSSNTVEKMMNDVGVVVKDHFSRLIFKMNEENKCVQSTIDYIKNMPIVLKLQEELREAREEIAHLKSLLGNDNCETIKLNMQEIDEKDTETSYDEISKLVSDKVNEKQTSSSSDFLSMYLNNQESDDDEDDDNTNSSIEQKTPIEIPYKRFLGLPKLDLDGAECSNEDEDEDEIVDGNAQEVNNEVAEEDNDEEEEITEEDEENEDEDEEEIAEEDNEEDEDEEDEDEEDEDEEDEDEEITEEDNEEDEEEISEEELEVDEVEIDGKIYFTTDDKNGVLYSVDEDGDIGDEIGYLKNGEPFFS